MKYYGLELSEQDQVTKFVVQHMIDEFQYNYGSIKLETTNKSDPILNECDHSLVASSLYSRTGESQSPRFPLYCTVFFVSLAFIITNFALLDTGEQNSALLIINIILGLLAFVIWA